MVITLSGADGVGKSTQLQKILCFLRHRNIDYRVMYVRVGRTPVSRLYSKTILRLSRKQACSIFYLTAFIGLEISLLELVYYWCIKIRFLNKTGRIVVCDRYIWDTYADLCNRCEIWNPTLFLWKWLLKHAAIPDVSVLYMASASVITERLRQKNEQLPWQDICSTNNRYKSIIGMFDFTVDASRDEDTIFQETISILKDNSTLGECVRYSGAISRKISSLTDADNKFQIKVKRINKGNSTARNYCVSVQNMPRFFVKVIDNRVKLLPHLQKITNQYRFLVPPVACFPIGTKQCIVMQWLDARKLSYTAAEAYQVAEILKAVHAQTAFANYHKSSTKVELLRYIFYIMGNKVDFPHQQEIIAYLLKNITLCRKKFSLVHMDVHCGNFLVDTNNHVRLIDYENLCVTDPWRDFVYACFFHNKQEDDFWNAVLQNYFNNAIPSDFWNTMQYYCYLHLLRMIICEHRKGKQDTIDMFAKLIWDNWNCSINGMPTWKR